THVFSYVKEIGYPAELPFKEVLFEAKYNNGATSVAGSIVPAGEVWEVNHIFLYVNDAGTLQLKKLIAGESMIFEQKEFCMWISWSGKILIPEGEKVYGTCSVSTNLVIRIYGVKRYSLEAAMASQKLRIDLIIPKDFDIQEPDAVKDPPM
ncbi:unnamed protein product, partial [marine sediment metagenome]